MIRKDSKTGNWWAVIGVATTGLIWLCLGKIKSRPKPKFGTLKGKVILDPHVFDPMTDEEVDAWIEGRY
jgi:hypothetical protein